MTLMRQGYLTNQITAGGGSGSLFLLLKGLEENYPELKKHILSSDCVNQTMLGRFSELGDVVVNKSISTLTVCQGSRPLLIFYILSRLRAKRDAKKVIRFCHDREIKTLHVNNSVFSHIYEDLSVAGIKIITHVREDIFAYGDSFISRYIKKQIEQFSTQIICIGEVEASRFDVPVKTIYNPNNKFVDHVPAPKKEMDSVNLLMMGRFARDKGPLLLLDAIKELAQSDLSVSMNFTILGYTSPGPLWRRFLKFVVKREMDVHFSFKRKLKKIHDLSNEKITVRVKGYVDDVDSYLQENDIYIRPSLFCDPWGRDIIEAMSFALPVVATGDNDIFVKPGETGYLCSKNPAELANRLWALSKNHDLRSKMAANALSFSRNTFDLSSYVHQISEVYKNVA